MADFGNAPSAASMTPGAVPVGEVYVPGTANSDLTALEGIAINTDGNGKKSSAARMGMKDGDNVTQGANADAAVVGDNAGTISAKLRGLTKIFNDIWDSVNHLFAINVKQVGGVATQMSGSDSVAFTNVPLVTVGMNNGSTIDKWRSANEQSDAAGGSGIGDVLSYRFNGTNHDREYNNQDNIVILASAARTATQTGSDQTNFNAHGIIVVLDMTVVGTGSVTLEIDGKDPVSGKYFALLTGAAVTTNSTNVYTVYPGNTVTTNVSASTVLPRTWRVKVTANNANSATYSVGAMLIV
jgi:hypothetical protein